MGKRSNYYIFGAHPRGWTLYHYIKNIEPEKNILGFLYNNNEQNPDEIEGIRVIKTNAPKKMGLLDTSAEVYIATRGVYHEIIIKELKLLGFTKIIPVSPELDTELRNSYVKEYFLKIGRSFNKINSLSSEKNDKSVISQSLSDTKVGSIKATVFVAKTAFDADFIKPEELKEYEKIIQAGTDLTDNRLSEAIYYDNEGDSISDRNPQFCELTALYWIWKHVQSDIIGLEHWRRRFILRDNWLDKMINNDIDVILPVPLCVMPSLKDNYKNRHVPEVWDKGMEVLKELHPEDYENASLFFRENNLYSPCNMIVAKRDVFSEYCEWLFPMLLRINDEVGVLDDKYQNRYPGFLAERYLNYFFEKNRDRFKIVYADKSFLS